MRSMSGGEEIVRRNQETARDGWSTQLSEAARSWTAGHAGSKGPTDCAECVQWGGRECTTIRCNPELTLPTGNVQLCIVDCTAYKCIPIYWEGIKGLCTYLTLLFSVLNPFHSEHLHEKDFSAPWKLVHCSSVLHQCECAPPQVPKLKQTSWTRVCLQRLSLPETCKSYFYEHLTADLFRLFLPLQAMTRWQDLIPIQAEEQKVENTGDN